MIVYISPYYMRRIHGWGPKGKTCGDCISCVTDDPDDLLYESECMHREVPHKPFLIEPQFKACGLLKSQWQFGTRSCSKLRGSNAFVSCIEGGLIYFNPVNPVNPVK